MNVTHISNMQKIEDDVEAEDLNSVLNQSIRQFSI
jgi:hypothetical protein